MYNQMNTQNAVNITLIAAERVVLKFFDGFQAPLYIFS